MTTALDTPEDDGDELARKRELLLARRTKVMFLRNAGATWPAIAEETGVSEATCRKDYAVVCRDINGEQPANIVARHRAVIFDIQRANYPAMMRGDKDAAATILKALDREAKLLGLDAPTRILAATSGEDFANEAARLIGRINELDPTTIKELTRVRRTDPIIIEGDTSAAQPAPVAAHLGTPDDGAAPDQWQEAPGDGGPAADAPHGQPGVLGQPGPAIDPGAWSNIDDD